MIKQIQLRGISRSPSDRLTEDGGCAESLNVQLEQQELAPMLTPQKVSKYITQNAPLPGKPLYIHKGNGYENVICLEDRLECQTVVARVVKTAEIGNQDLFDLNEGEELKDVKAIGNMLIFATDQRIEYVLRVNKDGDEYEDKGDEIPVPKVEFWSKMYDTYSPDVWIDTTRVSDQEGKVSVGPSQINLDSEKVPVQGLRRFNKDTWINYLNGVYVDPSSSEHYDNVDFDDSFNYINNALWEKLSLQINSVKKRGYFCTPVFARIALRLYDGNYIYQSVPILLGAGHANFMEAIGKVAQDGQNEWLAVRLLSAYKGFAQILNTEIYNGWEDIVESIDIFLSEDIHLPDFNERIKDLSDPYAFGGVNVSNLLFSDADSESQNIKEKNEVLSKSIFYKVKSFNIRYLKPYEELYDLMSDKNFVSQDYLKTQQQLPDGYLNFHRKFSNNLQTYNNKLILNDISYKITPGYQFLNGQTRMMENASRTVNPRFGYYLFKYYVKGTNNEDLSVMGRFGRPNNLEQEVGSYYIYYMNGALVDFGLGGSNAVPYAWLAYPDPRCYKVEVAFYESREVMGEYAWVLTMFHTYEMEAHPGLNCSFAYIGMDKAIVLSSTSEDPSSWVREDGERIYSENNTLWASVMDNPFVFLPGGKQTFTGKIIGMANTTKALSEGQFGQFPMYVFTSDGVWVLPINEEGSFTSRLPLSRDIAISKDSIVPIEQAIVFVTAQGVMLLQQSSITCLSDYMNGEHYVAPQTVIQILDSEQAVPGIQMAYQDNMRFNQFIEGCMVSYDYVDKRLIFFRPDKSYQYVYRIASQSWHKMSVENLGIVLQDRINSYPDCYIYATKTVGQNTEHLLYDFSVERTSASNQSVLPGLVITRQIDLGAADVRKVLVDLRLRGQVSNSHMKYLLLGSMDGLSWKILPSLRGGSYRRFRLVLVLGLTANERFSWVDMQYEERFTNRLR